MFEIGKYVTRKKYNNDIVFKIIDIKDNIYFLKGTDIRLIASAEEEDLVECKYCKKKEEYSSLRSLETNKYFYIPGSILHIDSDEEYKEKCEDYYRGQKVKFVAYKYDVKQYKNNIIKLVEKHNPNIIVITGHDAYYKKENKYLNSKYYIDTVKEIRNKYRNENLIIIAGACQSDYEGLLKAGSTYASSPTHSNIHALDPAIIASFIALTNSDELINIETLLSKTKYGSKGFGGIISKGKMLIGYPRKEYNEY